MANERGAADRSSAGPNEATSYSAEWSTFARRVAAIVLLVALVFAATLVRPILVAAILAAILAFLLSYVIRAIARHTRASYPLAVALVSIAYLVIGTLALFAVGVPTARFFGDLAAGARPTIESFVTFLASYTPEQGWVTLPATGERVNLDFVLSPLSDLVRSGGTPNLRDLASPMLALVGGTAATLGSLIGVILIADVLAIAFLFEAPAAGRAALRACPPNHRRELGILALAIQSIWSGYFRATIVCGALLGALTLAQLLVMGIPGAFVIGAFTAIVSVVPILGGFIALVPIGLAPLIDGSTVLPLDRWSLALLVVGVNLVIQLIMWNVIQPVIIGRAVSLSVTATIIAVAIGTALGGMLGAFIAVPVVAAAREFASYLLKKIRGGDPYPGVPQPAFVAVASDESDAASTS